MHSLKRLTPASFGSFLAPPRQTRTKQGTNPLTFLLLTFVTMSGAARAGDVDTAQSGPNYSVTMLGDVDDAVCGITHCTLREAITAANGNADASVITFDATAFSAAQTISVDSQLPDITQDLTLTGPSAGVTVSATASTFAIFDVSGGVTANFSGLTLSNGVVGIFNSGTLTATNCTFSGNDIGLVSNSTLTVTNCTFSGNTTGLGSQNGTATATNCTFSGNSEIGIHNDTTLTATNCTVSGSNEGIYASSSTVTLKNSIVAGNVTNIFLSGKGGGTTTDGGGNILTGTAADAGLDPAGLQNNGGPTQTIALLSTSPAINAGLNANATGIDFDQRGTGFPRISGGTVDIGAFELLEADSPQTGSDFEVNKTADTDDGVCSTSDCTLREAINAANDDVNASVITFNATVFAAAQTISVDSQLPQITANLTITGPSAGVTVSATANTFAIFDVSGGVTANFSGLTLSNGFVGIDNSGTLTATNCTFSDNSFIAIITHGPLTVTNCTFSGNDMGIVNNSTLTATNCTFSGNTAGLVSQNGTAIATNCTFSGNLGDGIKISGGTLTVTNCTVSGNNNGILNSSATVTLKNSIVAGNVTNLTTSVRGGTTTDGGGNILSGTAADAGLNPAGLQSNGGPTQTIALLSTSPAINAGNNAHATGLTTDQRGSGFPRIVGGTVDIGAYESNVAEGGNTAPVAEDQSVTTDEETVVTITLGASDADMDTLTYTITQAPAHGTLTNADNSPIVGNAPTSNVVKYTPELNYPLGAPPATGPDSFKFKANDGTIDSNEATVAITVNAVCDAPSSVGDSYSIAENGTLTVASPGVLGNDTEFDGETMTVFSNTNVSHGTLTLNANGGFTYKPTVGYNGPDSFTYVATDGALTGNTVTVNITVLPVPTITSLAPATGGVGTLVTLNGNDFGAATDVKINSLSVGAFTIVSAVKITFTVPVGATSGKITVVNANGSGLSVTPFTMAPKIISFTPASGSPGDVMTITGENFNSLTTAKIGGVAASLQSFSATQLNVLVPTAVVNGPVSVTGSGLTSTSATNFTVLPKITSFTPAGAAEGAAVTINGNGFTGATGVQFNGTAVSSFVVVSNTKITTTVPVNATAGKIAVVTPVGTALSANTFRLAPTVTNVTPTSGQKQSRVTITGKNLETATVKIGTVAQVITKAADRTATSITFTVPNTTVTGTITVTNAGGSTTAGTFTVLP